MSDGVDPSLASRFGVHKGRLLRRPFTPRMDARELSGLGPARGVGRAVTDSAHDYGVGSRSGQPYVIYLITLGDELCAEGKWEELVVAEGGHYHAREFHREEARRADEASRTTGGRREAAGQKKQQEPYGPNQKKGGLSKDNITNNNNAYISRRIDHPYFRNATLGEVLAWLATCEEGEARFSPSSSGPTRLRMSIKSHTCPAHLSDSRLQQDVVAHVEIQESRDGDFTSTKSVDLNLNLGKVLRITYPPHSTVMGSADHSTIMGYTSTFEDLDEVLARFVEPLMEKVRSFVPSFLRSFVRSVHNPIPQSPYTSPLLLIYIYKCKYEDNLIVINQTIPSSPPWIPPRSPKSRVTPSSSSVVVARSRRLSRTPLPTSRPSAPPTVSAPSFRRVSMRPPWSAPAASTSRSVSRHVRRSVPPPRYGTTSCARRTGSSSANAAWPPWRRLSTPSNVTRWDLHRVYAQIQVQVLVVTSSPRHWAGAGVGRGASSLLPLLLPLPLPRPPGGNIREVVGADMGVPVIEIENENENENENEIEIENLTLIGTGIGARVGTCAGTSLGGVGNRTACIRITSIRTGRGMRCRHRGHRCRRRRCHLSHCRHSGLGSGRHRHRHRHRHRRRRRRRRRDPSRETEGRRGSIPPSWRSYRRRGRSRRTWGVDGSGAG